MSKPNRVTFFRNAEDLIYKKKTPLADIIAYGAQHGVSEQEVREYVKETQTDRAKQAVKTQGADSGAKEIQEKFEHFELHILKQFEGLKHMWGEWYSYAQGVYTQIPQNKIEDMLYRELDRDETLRKFRTIKNINDKMHTLASLHGVRTDEREIDGETNIINVLNGLLEVTKKELKPHASEYVSVCQSPVLFDGKADCPLFKEKISDMLDNDEHLIAVFQEMFGYCLTNMNNMQKFYLLIGPGGNGKSVVQSVLTNLLGEKSVAHIPMHVFGQPFGLHGILGKRANVSSEIDQDSVILPNQIKAITGGDDIWINRKHKEPLVVKPTAKLIFSVNTYPVLNDRSRAMSDRMVIIPFMKSYRGTEKQENDLTQRLIAESSGILNWALEGLDRLRQNNYRHTFSQTVIAAIEEYKEETSPAIAFIKNNFLPGPATSRVKTTTMYDQYRKYAISMGNHPLSLRRFISEIVGNNVSGFNLRRIKNNVSYIGGLIEHLSEDMVELLEKNSNTTSSWRDMR